jgi:hypothetical protein
MTKLRTHFTFRIDAGHRAHRWRRGLSGCSANLPSGVERWPAAHITLRQAARVIEDGPRLRLAWSDKGLSGITISGRRRIAPKNGHGKTGSEGVWRHL